MAVPAIAREKFPQSLRRDSLALARRIGRRRLAIADAIERAPQRDRAMYRAMLREAA